MENQKRYDELYSQYKNKTNDELLQIINNPEEYQQIAIDVAKDIFNSGRTEYHNNLKTQEENKKTVSELNTVQNIQTCEDIHQIAGDIRFLKNLIIIGLILGIILIFVGIFTMI